MIFGGELLTPIPSLDPLLLFLSPNSISSNRPGSRLPPQANLRAGLQLRRLLQPHAADLPEPRPEHLREPRPRRLGAVPDRDRGVYRQAFGKRQTSGKRGGFFRAKQQQQQHHKSAGPRGLTRAQRRARRDEADGPVQLYFFGPEGYRGSAADVLRVHDLDGCEEEGAAGG